MPVPVVLTVCSKAARSAKVTILSMLSANFTKWNVWGDKEIDFITDDCLEWATHKDAVTHFYEWMDSHITYADSQWKI